MNLYLLYSGQSPDGRGTPKFIATTNNKEVAKAHFLRCKKNPYSTGKVEKLIKNKKTLILKEDDF